MTAQSGLVSPTKPLLRWAGSKRQLLGALASYWSDSHQRYVEPFAGSACLYFRVQPEKAVLGDLNKELIDFYRALATDPAMVWTSLRLLSGEEATYYKVRAQDPAALDQFVRAARFLYLNRFCFNGLYRTNSAGRFNVPYGGAKSGGLPDLATLERYSAAIQGVTFVSGDFPRTLEHVEGGDFVYLDPPYAVASQWRRGLHYTGDAFGVADVPRLASALARLDGIGAAFLVSYADSREGYELGSPYYMRTVEVRRSIAGSVFKRARRTELLISNRPHPAESPAA